MDRVKFKICKFCKSGNIAKSDNKKIKVGTKKMFKCNDCKRRFIPNPGFEKIRFGSILITRALRMYYTGISVRDVEGCYEQEGIKVSYRVIYNWVKNTLK